MRDAWDRIPCMSLASFKYAIVVYFQTIMFNLSGSVVRTSAVARRITVDVLAGTCTVYYHNGSIYDYTQVSRRALFQLLNNESMSLGFFINNHLLYVDSKCAMYGTERAWTRVSLA